MDDIFQKAILDVNRLKEVGMKAAQKKLIEKFSKDLKKMYIKEAEELAGDNFDDLLDPESGKDLDLGQEPASPSQNSGNNPELPGGDQLVSGEGEAGQTPNAGVEPQVEDPVLNNIPTSDVPDTEVELFIVSKDNTQGDSDLSSLESETDRLEQDLSVGNVQPDFEDELEANPDLNMNTDELDVNLDNIFDSINKDININDDILYEYIQKSFDNDEKFEKLSQQVQELNSLVNDLKGKLVESNKNLKQLKEQNIRLYYKNKAYNDDSLSERQKKSIVEAIDKANTIEQANLIFESAKLVKNKNNIKNSTVNNLLEESNVTKKFNSNSQKKQILEKKEEYLPKIAEKLFEKWGI